MILLSETDLDPCSWLIQSELGRLMPIGVLGGASRDSTITVMAFALIPLTSLFLCSGCRGEWSSNHWASSAMALIRLVVSKSRKERTLSKLPLIPSASLYTSIKPLAKSITLVVSFTQEILYSSHFFKSPVR